MNDASVAATLQVDAEELIENDEDQLFEVLGLRAQAMSSDLALAGQVAPEIAYDVTTMGPLDDLRAFGERLFRRLEREAYDFICGDDAAEDREGLLAALGVGDAAAVAAAIGALLVTSLGVAPLIAAAIGAIVVKRVLKPTIAEVCETWAARLEVA